MVSVFVKELLKSHQSALTDDHLQSVLMSGNSNLEPYVTAILPQKQNSLSSLADLNYQQNVLNNFYCVLNFFSKICRHLFSIFINDYLIFLHLACKT